MSKAKQPSNIAKSGITSVRSEESQRDKYINSFVSARLGGATASEAHSTAANKALKDVIKANQNKTSRIQEGLANGTMYEKDGRYYYTDEAQNQYVKSAAEQYADRLQATQAQNAWEETGINIESAQSAAQKFLDKADGNRFLNALGGWQSRQIADYVGAFGNVVGQIADWTGNERLADKAEQAQERSDVMRYIAESQTQASKEGLGKIGQTVVDVGQTLSDVAMDTATTVASFGLVPGLAAMGTRAFGSAAAEKRMEGASIEEQNISGLKSAAIEVLTEKIGGPFETAYGRSLLGDATEDALKKISKNAVGRFALSELGNFLSEGGEEVLSGILNPLADRVLKLDDGTGKWFDNIDWKETMYEGLLGGLTGAIGGAVSVNTYRPDPMLQDYSGNSQQLIQAAKDNGKKSDQRLATRYGNRIGEDGSLTNKQAERLLSRKSVAQAYADAIQNENNQKKAEAEKNAAIQNFVKGTEAEGSDVTQTIDKDAVRSNYGGKERTVSMVRVDGQNLMKLTDTADNTAVAMTLDEVRENDALPDDVRIFASMLDSKLGENAPAAYEAYDGNMSTGEYAIAMHEAINLYAGNGADLTETVKKLKSGENVGSPVAKLNSAQISVAQSAGNKIYQQKKLDMNSLRTKYADQAKAIQQARETSAADIRKIDTSIAEVNGEIKKAGENLAEANRTLSGLQEGAEEYRQARQQVTYWQNYITQAEEALNVLNSAKIEAQNKAPAQRAKGTVSYAGAENVNSDYKPVDKNNLTKKQSKAIKAVEVLADHFNLKFVLFDGDSRGDQGKFEHIGDDGTIYINVNAGGGEMVGIAGTLSHELTHTMQQYSPADYEDLKNEILKIYFNNDPALFERRVRFYMSSQGLDYDSAVDEIIANTCTTMLRDSDAIAQLARDNMNLAQKILDTLRNIVKEAFEDFRAARTEEKFYEEYRDQFDEVIRLWESGIRNAASNYNNGVSQSIKNTAPESGVKLMAWESDDTSTSIDTDPNKHSASDMARINSYVASVDKSLKNVFVKYYNDPKSKFSRHKISDASERQIKDAEKLLGQNFEGYTNSINSNSVKHIISEHGPDGSVNHSLRNLNDAARIGYILDNYDSVELGTYASGDAKYSDEFRDRNNNPSSILKYSKKIDGTYYVVEAAAENNYKKFWVVSAYIEENKKSVTQAPDANGPENTPKASLASPLDLNIAEPEKAVKENATGQFQKYVDGQISMDELQAEDEYAARYIREGYHPAIAERLAEGDRIRDKLTRFFARLPDYEGKPTAEDIDNAIDVNPYSDAVSGYMNSADELLNDIAYAVEWGFVPEKSKNTAFRIMEQMLNQMSTQLQVDWEATYHGKPKFREFAEWYEKRHGKGNSTYTVSEDMRNSGGVNRRYQKWDEEHPELVAVHNKSVNGLRRMLTRNGVPFPSIAIKKAGAPHEGFGDVSIVFPRETIDPEASKWNRLYSNDAWTPTEPPVEYDVGDTYSYQKRIKDLIGRDAYVATQAGSYLEPRYLEEQLRYRSGDITEDLMGKDGIRLAYLKDKGEIVDMPQREKSIDGFGKYKNEQLVKVFDAVGGDAIMSADWDDTEVLQKIADVLNQDIEKDISKKLNGETQSKLLRMLRRDPTYTADKINIQVIKDAYRTYSNNGFVIPGEIDGPELRSILQNGKYSYLSNDEDFRSWVQNEFKDLVKDKGIPNGKSYYTDSGNPRSFKARHVEATMDNIIKEMRKQEETGIGVAGINIRGAATKAYRSVEEMRGESGRLLGEHVADDVFDSYMNDFHDRLYEITDRARKFKREDSYGEAEEQILLEAVRDGKTKAAMDRILQSNAQWINYSKDLTDNLWELKQDVQNMPAPYFEAKPRRFVTPDEAVAYIIPDNTDQDVVDELNKRGLNVLSYKAGNDADRLEKLNSVQGARFQKFDSDGNELSNQQVEFFAGSKARAGDGRLLKLYHGTMDYGFTVFDNRYSDDRRSFFMTDSLDMAQSYSDTNMVRSAVRGDSNFTGREIADAINRADPGTISGYEQEDIPAVISWDTKEIANASKEAAKFLSVFDDYVKDVYTGGTIGERRKKTIDAAREQLRTIAEYDADNPGNALKLLDGYKKDNILDLEYLIRNLADEGDISVPEQKYDGLSLIEFLRYAKELDKAYSINKNGGGMYLRLTGWNGGIELYSEDELKDYYFTQYGRRGNYPLYANITNPMELDAHGNNWNFIQWDGNTKYSERREQLLAELDALAAEGYEFDPLKLMMKEIQDIEFTDIERRANDIYEELSEIGDRGINIGKKNWTTRELSKYANENGYDGVIIRNVHDSGGRGRITPDAATVVIAFYPEQIKDAENKNPTNNPDIRFQKWDSGAGDTAEESRERVRAQVRIEYENQLMHDTISSLNKELEKLQAKYEKQGLKSGEKISELKRELKLTKTPEVRKADAKKIAKAYIEKANSTADAEQITDMIVDLGNYIVQGTGETLDEDVIVKKAHNIAALLVEKAAVKDTSGMEAYQKLASDIKGRKFVLPEEDRGDLDIEGGYDRFRKKNFGRFMLVNEGGTPVSTAYAELQNAYGTSLLPDVRNQGDMIRIMADVFDLADPDEINPFSNSMAQAAAEFTNDIIYEVLGEELRQKAPTFADKAKAKQDALKAENKELGKELKAEAREANREKTRLEKALDKTERQLARVKAEKDAKIAELKEKGTARVQQARAKEKAAKWAKVKEVRDLYRERERTAAEKRKESAGISKYRKQVIEKASKLYELVTVNSDKKHVPKVLRGPLAEFLESINFDSKQKLSGGENTQADDKFGTKLQRLHNILSKQREFLDGDGTKGVDLGGYVDISQESLEYLRIMSEGVTEALDTGREFTINTMTAEELKGLSRFLTGLTRAISNMNTFLANEAFKDIGDVAGSDMRHMQKLGSAKSGVNRGVSKFLNWKNATPYYAMQRFGEGGKSIFRSLVKGWGKMAMNVKTIEEFTDKTYTRKEVNSWKNDVHEFTLSDGNKIKMTAAQIMELSMLLEREQAVKHIDHGGIRIGEISTNKEEVNDTKHYHLSSEDILNIIGKLSDRQMQVANELRTFMAEYGAELGNEVSMARFGYESYDEGPKYYPIKTDSNDRALSDKDENKNSSVFRLLNLSASKSLNPNASNALVVGDIFDTFADHMADMAKLNGLGLPVLDFIKWFNYKERTDLGDGQYDVESMMATIEDTFGSEALKYIRTLIKDINGVHESGERGGDFWGKLSSNYKVSAVAANLRVALLQPTAYVRSSFILKPQYLAGAFGMKNGYQEALKHSGTAQWKSMGYYDTNISRNMREQIEHDDSWKDRLVEGSMKLAELGDQLTWGRLWNACKLQTKAETGLSGEELNRKTAELFDEVIYATQVMDSTLTRSELMRSASSYDKMFTAFMAEPTVSYNLLLDAYSKYSLDVRKNGKANALGRNSGTIMKAFAVYAASSAFSAIVESFADAIRDDDDEEFYEKFLQAFLGEGDNAIERFYDGNLGSDLSFVGKIPFAKDIISTIQGYGGTSNMSSEGIQTIVEAVKIWEETIKLKTGKLDDATKTTYYGKMTGWGKVYKTLQGLSQLSGIPASAALRDVFAIWNNFAEYALEEPGWKITTYDADKLSGSSPSTYKEYIQPTGMSEREYTTMLDSADAAGDGNGSVKQDELGYYLMAAEKSGELSSAQIYAIWASKEYKTSYQDWKAKHK